ncbi:MAG: outer membrane protein assembly factor BamD, partial [Planctomycetota bacterium]
MLCTPVLLLIAFLSSAPAAAQEPAPAAAGESALPDLPVIPEALRRALLHGRHQEAVELARSLEESEPEQAGLWVYLQGLAFERAGDPARARDLFRRVETEYPTSGWADKARFRRAEAHARLGEWSEAEQVWEQAAGELRSAGRQGELAAIYLRIADDLAAEPAPDDPGSRPRDLQRAEALYSAVLGLEAPPADRERARFQVAWCREELGRSGPAVEAWRAYLDEFGRAGELVFTARLHLARSLLAAGDPTAARRAFEDLEQDLVAAFDGRGDFADRVAAAPPERRAAWRELAGDAAFERAGTWPDDDAGQRRAIDALRAFLTAWPDHRRAPEAAFGIADRAFQRGWLGDAIAGYDAFLARPPREDAAAADREREAELRQTALYRKGVALLRQERYEQAIATFAEYTRRHPNGPDWAAAQQGMIDAEYELGAHLADEKQWEAARAAWERFLADHPLDRRAPATLLAIGRTWRDQALALAEDDPARAAGLRSAIAVWNRLVGKYPGSAEASVALFRIGQVQETGLMDLPAAIEAYRRCDFGPSAGDARERLRLMTRPHLAVRTERVWRNNEPARLRLDTRNVNAVRVQVYPLDLEAYFRKHLTWRKVEDLDLDLIAPEIDYETPVPGAADYLPIETDLELPVEGPGVWAVAVTAGHLRATTLVVRSDLDVILKSSRREVFVFAQDMRRGEPAADVSVLLALPRGDGSADFHELRTGEDGVARLELDELAAARDVRLFAVRDGHCAADGLGLGGLGLARGLGARGLAYTDRPAYRPGDTVSWRAILRHVEGGSYVVREKAPVRWRVIDARGRELAAGEEPLGPFGTVHGSFALPPAAATGGWQIVCEAEDDLVVQGAFTVAEYRLPRVQLSAEVERSVLYRGEEAVVSFTAAWAYGEPLAGARLVVDLPDGRRRELRTDADGRAELRFPTRDFDQEQLLAFAASLPEEGAAAVARAWLAVEGFRASLELPRDTVLAGETFTARIRTRAPSGEAVGRRLRLDVLRRESHRGRWSETRVQSHELATDEEDGLASIGLAVADGGRYLLRVVGEDRFGNLITAERALFVSGEEDEVKLRILADDTSLEVGETLRATIHNRAGAGLALLTFEGERILGYRVVRLGEGANALALKLGHEHFPNFVVAAAMMRGNEFHTARADFSVARRLQVTIEPERERYAPGETAWVNLRVTDQLGNPVRAELSLGVVDATLYDLYADPTPALRPFFEEGAWREAGFRTASSCTFSYQGVTREIAEAVIEEAKRIEELARFAQVQDEVEELEEKAGRPVAGGRWRGPGNTVPPASAAPAAPGEPAAEQQVMLGGELRSLGYVADDEFGNAQLGLGGGAGGKAFGGRRGGRLRGRAAEPEGVDAVTAFWAPAVVTDAEGRARVGFPLPATSTTWRLTARGVGRETLLGERTAAIVSRGEFFVELTAPPTLVEGDRPAFLARVHNRTGLAGRAELKLRVGRGGETVVLPAEAEVAAGEVAEVAFPALEPVSPGPLHLSLEAEGVFGPDRHFPAGAGREREVRPWGLEVA